MAKTVPFSLITPTGIAFDGEASLVIAAGTEGEIGIMAAHAPYLTALKPGVLRADVRENGEDRCLVLAISSGFLQALPERVRVMVDVALQADEIDAEKAQAELDEATARQKNAGDDKVVFTREQEIIDFANAKLAARAL